MRKCCFFDILFLYCFSSFVNRVMSIDYQIVTTLHWNIVNMHIGVSMSMSTASAS